MVFRVRWLNFGILLLPIPWVQPHESIVGSRPIVRFNSPVFHRILAASLAVWVGAIPVVFAAAESIDESSGGAFAAGKGWGYKQNSLFLVHFRENLLSVDALGSFEGTFVWVVVYGHPIDGLWDVRVPLFKGNLRPARSVPHSHVVQRRKRFVVVNHCRLRECAPHQIRRSFQIVPANTVPAQLVPKKYPHRQSLLDQWEKRLERCIPPLGVIWP